ncbi:MAG: ankyrin repeat domain-containing protein [Gammaproteobacteria bacterium]|nr:ankyrin repeat domain-containing protein [Gammaproteobacteria bacterium]
MLRRLNKSSTKITFEEVLRAIHKRKSSIVRKYIEQCTSDNDLDALNKKTAEGKTLLMLLIEEYAAIIKDIEKNKYAFDEYGATNNALQRKMEKFKKTIEVLLDAGADVNAQDLNNNTALHYAAKNHLHELMKTLDVHGANPLLANDKTQLPRHLVPSSNVHLIKSLKRSESETKIRENHEIPTDEFYRAIKEGNLPIVELYLSQHNNDPACLNMPESKEEGITPLMVAAFYDQPHIVHFLLDKNVDVHATDAEENNALHYATRILTKDTAVIVSNTVLLALIKAGININAPNAHGNTPLHLAAREGIELFVCTLLECKADASLHNHEGKRPSELAPPYAEYYQIIMSLLEIAESRDEEIAQLKLRLQSYESPCENAAGQSKKYSMKMF